MRRRRWRLRTSGGGEGTGSQIVFSAHTIFDYRTAIVGDRAKSPKMMLVLFKRDIFINPMGTKFYLSLAHDEAACDEFFGRLKGVLKGM